MKDIDLQEVEHVWDGMGGLFVIIHDSIHG